MNPQLEELACLYILDQLDPGERTAFETRLLSDSALAVLVHELEDAMARRIRTLPQAAPPAGMITRIETRLNQLSADATPPFYRAVFPAFARWGLAAVITVSLATLAVQSLRHTAARPMVVFVGLDADHNTFAEVPLREPGKDADARFIQLASLAENYWKKPGDLPFKPRLTSGDNRGYALFDPGSQQGFIAIEQLPAIADSQRYHLWIIDPATGLIRDAGTLPLAGMNRGLYSFTLGPSDGTKSPRPNFFITVEEIATTPVPAQPRGKVVLGRQRI